MKKTLSIFFIAGLLTSSLIFTGCPNNTDTPKEDDNDKTSFSITGGEYTTSEGKIELNAVNPETQEGVEYEISGEFTGQIIVKVKGTKIKLNGATLSNENEPVIYCEKKCEISAAKDTTNTITMTGESAEKTAAILGEKNLEFGGSGTCDISGNVCHGIKGDKVIFKGSGKYSISATSDGSAINCNNFAIEADKNVDISIKNAKNGIKADTNVSIKSGTLRFTDCGTAIKTDKAKDDEPGAEPVDHFIKISGAKLYMQNVDKQFSTEGDAQVEDGCIM